MASLTTPFLLGHYKTLWRKFRAKNKMKIRSMLTEPIDGLYRLNLLIDGFYRSMLLIHGFYQPNLLIDGFYRPILSTACDFAH